MKDKALNDLIKDYIMDKAKEGYAGSHVKSTPKAVKSWLLFNGIKLQRNPRIRGAEDTPTLENEKVS